MNSNLHQINKDMNNQEPILINKNIERLSVSGSRNFNNKRRVYEEINRMRKKYPNIKVIISGVDEYKQKNNGPWVDVYAREYAKEFKLKYIGHEPDWTDFSDPEYCLKKDGAYGAYNAMAGLKRNGDIARDGQVLLAIRINMSKGTTDTIKKAEKLNRIVEVVDINLNAMYP